MSPSSSSFMSATLPEVLPDDPMAWVEAWLGIATEQAVQRNPNAMTLATVGADGSPSARVVLCKSLVADPGFVVFYTNYGSRKLADIEAQRNVAVTFHWDALGRQARLEGPAVRSPAAESDAYFAARGPGSQLGAWGSDQSRPIASREALIAQLDARARQLGVDRAAGSARDASPSIPRPPYWGGVRIWPCAVELWLEGVDRIHDRARWTRLLEPRDDHSFGAGPWSATRLQP